MAAGDGTVRRRSRQAVSRPRVVQFSLTEEEFEDVSRAAERSGLARGAFATEAALASARGARARAWSPLREALAEVIAAAGLVRRAGTNLNQAVTCRRCRTASWWRRIKISVVFHVSSRRDSRSHAASRVAKRNRNRRHMIGDHRGRSAGRATLLVRAVDAILGTYTVGGGARGAGGIAGPEVRRALQAGGQGGVAVVGLRRAPCQLR